MKNYVQKGESLTIAAPYDVLGCVSKVVEILFRRPPSGLICV